MSGTQTTTKQTITLMQPATSTAKSLSVTAFYYALKPYQMAKDDRRSPTMHGLPPTPIRCYVEGYRPDPDARDAFFTVFDNLKRVGQQFALTESIADLETNALTKLRFDIDVHLPTDDDSEFRPVIGAAIKALQGTLAELTDVEPGTSIHVLCKPAPTQQSEGVWKHGCKLVFPDVICTHEDMLCIRQAMNDRYEQWGPPE